jgi:hypothetical protein
MLVPVTTLATVLDEHLSRRQPIHFLKVDVEGSEREVLLGNDWKKYRPWIVVVEATHPMTREPAYRRWESILTDSDYRCIYHDGLNRFYVASEHQDLEAAFDAPPNWFDGFMRASERDAIERAASAEAEIRMMRGSRSWRLTAPFRDFARLWRRARAAARAVRTPPRLGR